MTQKVVTGRTRDTVIFIDRFILGLSRHWLLAINLVMGLWVLLPWLAALTNNAFAPTFYAGDATGLLASSASVWLIFPYLEDGFADIRKSLEAKFRRV